MSGLRDARGCSDSTGRYFDKVDQAGRDKAIFVMSTDGADVRRLAYGMAGSWSADGSKILYTSSFASPLFVMDADGSHKRRIALVAVSEPSWR